MRSVFALLLFPLLSLCDTITRDDCWCRNATHIAWSRHLQLDSVNIPGPNPAIDQWCIDETPDGHGECLDWHTKQYTICVSQQALGDKSKRNDYCYKNHGNSRGLVSHFSKGPDTITYNGHQRNIPFKNPAVPMTLEENSNYCEPICRDFHDWKLPIMIGLGGKHGLVESRHQVFNDVENFPFEDGHDGQWPVLPSTRYHPGGIDTSDAGVIDYWEVDVCKSIKYSKDCPQNPDGEPSTGY
ncbi:MAG: hypothetical protein Q9169_003607 [Polycauliona sp. 2 TL-2023]